jgi:Second Messenger Oligonucleotide or Dinucleotide Synthetase domain
MPLTITASANKEFDEILDLLAITLQLTATQFKDAEGKYHAVSDWLNADNSPVRIFSPSIYSQGSLRLDTTVKPISHTEFDLDLVCELIIRGGSPHQVYQLLWNRMHSNGRYRDILVAKPRCIRLNYAGQFHLDIVPAIPAALQNATDTTILVPDRAQAQWISSNPKGFAIWFEAQTIRYVQKHARLSANENVEPLRTPTPAYSKHPLKLAVQLFKRWRDIAFKGRMDLAPSSIVLTSLSGMLYDGEGHPSDALATILDRVCLWASREPIHFTNPANLNEWLTDCWDKKPESYDAFVEEVFDFRDTWHKLIAQGRYPAFADQLQDLFGSSPVIKAVEKFAESRGEARRNGSLYSNAVTGAITTYSTADALKVKPHTFHGA